MLEFSFEIVDDSKINIQYKYGSAMFAFNLFLSQGVWTLHPFDGILLQNKEMCSLVVAELFKNKDYQVMLARENILFSSLRTSIDLQPAQDIGTRKVSDHQPSDEITDFVESHSFEDILNLEIDQLQQRIDFFQDILHRMFMDGYGPGDTDFKNVQELVRTYKETCERIRALSGGTDRRDTDSSKRW
ncbi:hypothetical protein Back11_42330 [Paenibacillus baekrokdamisoli]|uniref:Uncharacterized protein n=1 Tax=Paenibacillus baekrokdamisoli TaxID=1712516 RepID=A0A3G9JFP9_9BACL|nr:hypothetical protein [Paenibacillus baekrokdamisoli]MBB3068068.1 hypothetical protein [Paenibacillus baekrokdamisoli]BBH22888.1 hypothetical protein Back11_42330 [Paenibacillus baekrokdamisoli]